MDLTFYRLIPAFYQQTKNDKDLCDGLKSGDKYFLNSINQLVIIAKLSFAGNIT